MGFVDTYDIKKKNKILTALLVGVIYATLDEIHQIFVGTRSPAIKDIFIDSFGILFGILIFALLHKFICKTVIKM